MRIACFFIFIALFSCRKTYNPDLNNEDKGILVVEGNIDPGSDSTFIRLTRSVIVGDTTKIKTENNARLTVEGSDNSMRVLAGKGNGFYAGANLGMIIGNDYRLRIKTTNGEEYLSDYVKAKRTPSVDSLNWVIDTTGLNVYVTTHDPSNSTIYYRWDCVETWEIKSRFHSFVIYQNGIVRPRLFPPDDDIFICWKYDSTATLVLANSERLSNDIIYQYLIKHIPYHDERLEVRYSMQVKQYALEKPAYEFFKLMKENTENIGSLFSPPAI